MLPLPSLFTGDVIVGGVKPLPPATLLLPAPALPGAGLGLLGLLFPGLLLPGVVVSPAVEGEGVTEALLLAPLLCPLERDAELSTKVGAATGVSRVSLLELMLIPSSAKSLVLVAVTVVVLTQARASQLVSA